MNERQYAAPIMPVAAAPQALRGGSRLPRRVGIAVAAIVLVAAVCIVYGPAVDAPFIFDDASAVVGNSSILKLWPLVSDSGGSGPLNPPAGHPISGRPLVNLSLALNYHFGQFDPRGYHVFNIVLHLLSSMLLWAIVWHTLCLDYFRGKFERVAGILSFGAALVWAVHPLATESVIYVTQRTESMMGLFYLATVYASLRYWDALGRSRRIFWLLLATLACLSGSLCKEMMASVPAMILLYERTFIARTFRRSLQQSWPLYLGLALGWIALLAINRHGPRTPLAGFDQGIPAYVWWFTQAKVLLIYLKLAFWPWPLVIHYNTPYLETLGDAWPFVLPTAILGFVTLVLLWRRSVLGYACAWVLVVLSPTLVVPLLYEVAAERRMYVPLTAIAALVVVGGYELARRIGERLARRAPSASAGRGPIAFTTICALALSVVLGLVSARRLAAYDDAVGLWRDALIHEPEDPIAHFNLGGALVFADRREEGIEEFERALQLDPDMFPAHYNLARALEESARLPEAIWHYREVLRLLPDSAAAHNNLALLLANAGKTQQAIDHYEQALSNRPDFSQAHNNLAILLARNGQMQQAIEHFVRALQLTPTVEAYSNLAAAYAQANRSADAISAAESALKLARSQGETDLAAQLEAALSVYRNSVSRP